MVDEGTTLTPESVQPYDEEPDEEIEDEEEEEETEKTQGSREEHYLEWAFGSMGTVDRAKYVASLFLEDLGDALVDPARSAAFVEVSAPRPAGGGRRPRRAMPREGSGEALRERS